MNEYIHLAKAAIEDFRRNKVRTALTSLGILIGVMSVVLLIALGLGLKNYIEAQFNSMGANLVMIMPGSGISGGTGNRRYANTRNCHRDCHCHKHQPVERQHCKKQGADSLDRWTQ